MHPGPGIVKPPLSSRRVSELPPWAGRGAEAVQSERGPIYMLMIATGGCAFPLAVL